MIQKRRRTTHKPFQTDNSRRGKTNMEVISLCVCVRAMVSAEKQNVRNVVAFIQPLTFHCHEDAVLHNIT